MALFNKAELKLKAQRSTGSLHKSAGQVLVENSAQFSESKKYDIFLSNAFSDADLIYALQTELREFGYSVYVDWIEDGDLNRSKVNKETAARLKGRMANCLCLFYAVSPNAQNSIWMPWELGYFDGIKRKVALLPIVDRPDLSNTFRGQEYLGLYPYVTKAQPQNSSKEILWIWIDPSTYVDFESWLHQGKSPYRH